MTGINQGLKRLGGELGRSSKSNAHENIKLGG
jgi:hypothetical protein